MSNGGWEFHIFCIDEGLPHAIPILAETLSIISRK